MLADHRLATRLCWQCGTTITVTSKTANNPNHFHSRACAVEWRRTHRRPLAERWTRHTRKGEGCWEWMGYRDKNGYGHMGGKIAGTSILTHRASWEIHFGPIPANTHVLHKCDNPPCGRPDHLFLGTALDNMRDASRKHRTTQGERGHCAKLTAGQVLAIRARYAAGGISHQALADAYGVARESVSELIRRETWKHLP